MVPIFFGSNLAARDLLWLPGHTAQWPKALDRISGVRVAAEHIMAGTEPGYLPMFHPRDVGVNTYQAFVQTDWFRRMRALDKLLVLGVGAIKPGDCDATINTALTQRLLARIHDAGGQVDYIIVDSPLSAALNHCGKGAEEAAGIFARYIRAVRAFYPTEIGFVDHQSLPVETWKTFITTLIELGTPPAFVSVDVDRNALKEGDWAVRLVDCLLGREARKVRQMRADLAQLFTFLDQAGIATVMEIWGQAYHDAKSYRQSVMSWARLVRSLAVQPKVLMVESWEIVGGTRGIPLNLPETNPYTHTALINDIACLFDTPEAKR